MQLARPHESMDLRQSRRLLVLHCGGPAPGMNTAVRAATRLALESGHTVLAAQHGFRGLFSGDVKELDWMSVHGWVGKGGAELGTSRRIPAEDEFGLVAEALERHQIDMMLMIGGWSGYLVTHRLHAHRLDHPALNIPICCIPASINNNLPGSEYSIGADTALNSIVRNVDQIKQSAVASHRCFIVEVMGKQCGYLALMSGLSTGAERVYLPEDGISLDVLQRDVCRIVDDFQKGKRLGLFIRSERADASYTTDFIARLFEKEGADLFDVRQSILGHLQQGGNPTPYDRIQATRLAARAVRMLEERAEAGETCHGAIGLQRGNVTFTGLEDLEGLVDPRFERPLQQNWLNLTEVVEAMALRSRAEPSDQDETPEGDPGASGVRF
jgi:6-phosphofructokinase 1